MGRNGRRDQPKATGSWEGERTMAAAEEDAAASGQTGATARCACGSDTMLLQAFLQVVDGRITPEPVEVETLTCPGCGREYEPILKSDGTVLRGDFLGYFEEGDE